MTIPIARFDGFDETQPGLTRQDVADLSKRLKDQLVDAAADAVDPAAPRIEAGQHRSGFAEFEATGRYPLRPGLEDRSAALVLSATTAGALARISARGQVNREAWRKAQAEARKAGRS